MPIDAIAALDGNLILDGNTARIAGTNVHPGVRYISHFATCSHPERHRRK
jgi:hypothetical protein